MESLEKLGARYGDIFTTRFIGFPPIAVVSDPQAIQEIFTADPKLFESGTGNKTVIPIVGEQSLLLQDGERHQKQRRLLTPPFHGERMRAYGQLMREITEGAISRWAIGKPFSARSSMQEISLRIILRAVFGIDEGERFQQLRHRFTELLDTFNSPLSSILLYLPALQQDLGAWSPWGRFLRLRQEIDQLIYAEIGERREQFDPSRQDILSLMMSARDESGQPMTDVELRDELMTLLFAGHETTATALAWALYWIHSIPEVGDKLLKELDALSPNSDPSEIARLPYLSAVCSETLRIYPVALFAFGRMVKEPIQIRGYDFEPGTLLSPCIYLTHHRPEIYPEPKRFKPERFLEKQFSPYEYLPFGGSNRRCLGMAFALFEMKLVLATILSRVQLALADKRPVRPERRGVTIAPSRGVRMLMTGSRQPQVSQTPVQV